MQIVRTGLDVLLAEHLEELHGCAVGIVANHAAVTSDLVHISDALNDAGVKIAALFGPEHGARGDIADGAPVSDSVDERLGVPVYSLYGKTRSPDAETLRGVDVMIIDFQDVGARFYTFTYTMANVLAACGCHQTPVWILDRPNPISGTATEGPVLQPEFSSFIGLYPIPVRHGLTLGELARLFMTQFGVKCDARVIKMKDWKRDMWYDETGLLWVLPSPNMPTVETAAIYPGTCLLEGTNVSEGRGTVRPFEMFGAPWVDARKLRERLIAYDLPGVVFREAYFIPCSSKFREERCAGVQVYVTDRKAYKPVLMGVAVVSAFRELHPDKFAFRPPAEHGRRFFDLLAGNSAVREAIEVGRPPREIAASWEGEAAGFVTEARAVMLY